MHALDLIGRWGLRWAMGATLAAALIGCGGLRYAPKGTPRAPDADAYIEAQVSQANAMTQISVKIEHLAPPDRLVAGSTSYVVWARRDDGAPWARVGSLKYDGGSRKGELYGASVPETSFELIVSAEKQTGPAGPSADVVVAQKVGAQ